MNILLTSAGRRSYLVRYFKEALDHEGQGGLVHASNSAWCPAFSCADRTVVTPMIHDRAYIPFLLEYCKREAISLLIPLFDIDIPVLAAHREEFAAAGVTVVTADPEAAGVCNDKWLTHQVLTQADIRVPAAWTDREAALAAIKDGAVSWPITVKPRWGMGSISVYRADNEEELRVFEGKCRKGIQDSYLKYESMEDKESCVLFQETLKGQEYGLDVINDLEGRYRSTIVKKKIAMRSGETDAAESVEHKGLSDLGKKLGVLLGHRGNLDVDVFIEDGTCLVLELNARFGGGYPFSHAAGANLPLALVLWAMGKEADQGLLTARAGVRAQKDIQMLVL